ncbi:MAG TPA: response regulator [Patescibacteria group bacterium]|nr:response regulator [Patescibacteria group bacterium]
MTEERKTVLVADDDELFASYVACELKRAGVCAYEAYSWSHLREILKEMPIDCILLDVIFPDKHGFTVLAELRMWEKARHIPVVFFSGLSGFRLREQAFALGAKEYFVKGEHEMKDIVAFLLRHVV